VRVVLEQSSKFALMLRTIWVIVLLLVGVCAFAQNQPNPFDLKYRTAAHNPVTAPAKPVVLTDSLAEINKKPQAPSKELDTVITEIFPPGSLDTSEGSNPFDLGKSNPGDTLSVTEPEESIKEEPAPQREVRRPSKGVQIFLLLLSLLFLIFIVNVERSFVRDLWRVISNENYSSLHLRNQRNTMRQILLFMGYLVFIMQAGIFLYHALIIFNYNGTLFDNVWSCMALILMVYLIRHTVIGYLKWLFNNEKEMNLYSFDISIFNIMVGLVLLPINVLINFGPDTLINPLIMIGLIIAIVAYSMRQLRWVLTARHLITNSLFLFFVYLCAVEILPLWAISKFLW
jgi:hypothetical protein